MFRFLYDAFGYDQNHDKDDIFYFIRVQEIKKTFSNDSHAIG